MLETDDKTKEMIEKKFVDYFQMTVDQFNKLEFDIQEQLIRKALWLQKKEKKLYSKENSKFRMGEIFTYFPIFTKDSSKIKRK